MLESLVEGVVVVLETVGIATMVIGFLVAGVFSVRALLQKRGGQTAFKLLRTLIGSSILLGLEILVAADLIRTVLAPTLQEAAVLAIIVAIRTVLSISIQIEIEGVLPWRRALFESGGAVLANAVKQETRGRPADPAQS